MTPVELHADRRMRALVHGAQLPWLASPHAGVQRRMLERNGGEVALATSIVRYAPGGRFAAHVHALGEEFLVLDGTFSDEHGDYRAGTYVRNPPGSSHTPFSRDGCVIFVKLRQMRPDESETVRLFPHEQRWDGDRRCATLYRNARISVALERMAARSAPTAAARADWKYSC